MDTLKFFWKYPNIITLLKVIHFQVKVNKYDFPFVICGNTGTGKSMLLMHIYEIWYRAILGREVTEQDAYNIRANRTKWLLNFKEIDPLEFNPNDEAADGLLSKDSMKRFSRTIEKLYNVNRKKHIISPLTLPDFFDLPPYFRKRIRGLFYCYERGKFKFYSMNGVKYLNGYNATLKIKNMDLAYPLFTGVFPDYTGVMRNKYNELSQADVDTILDEVIKENTTEEKNTKTEILTPAIKNYLKINPDTTIIRLSEIFNISKSTTGRIVKSIKEE